MSFNCTMILGDCLDVMPSITSNSTHMCFADIPYSKRLHCDWDKVFDLDRFNKIAVKTLTSNGVSVFSSVQPLTSEIVKGQMSRFKYTLVWDKIVHGSPQTARYRPLCRHEDICVFGTPKSTYNPIKTKREKPVRLSSCGTKYSSKSAPIETRNSAVAGKIYLDRLPDSIIVATSRHAHRGLHPTQKPVALLDWLIKTYSNPGDTVLDPVSGSFTTCVSACLNGRNSVGIEKDPGYFEAGVERVCKTIKDNSLDVKLEVRR